MAGSIPPPRLSKNPHNTQLSYELPHRIHTAKIYPIEASNGSTIFLYGHEQGVRVVWRGGRSFKPSQDAPATNTKTNGSEGAVIMLDSDDDVPASRPLADKPEFEDEEEDYDPLRPYPALLQELDLYFGTDVLHLALLPTPLLKAGTIFGHGLEQINRNIVFTAACADSVVRLITLPLTPPSPQSKSHSDFKSDFTLANAGNGRWGETVIELRGHQKPSDGIAMTALIPTKLHSDQPTEPQIVVASHSRDVTGSLLLFRVSIVSPQVLVKPFQTVLLASPATSISFNTSLSSKRSSRLLVADTTGACRIYDYRLLVKSSSSEEPSDGLAPEQGTFLFSLYPGFQRNKIETSTPHPGAHSGFGRKTIVDTKWVAGGKAIVVLLSDGEWAIWDIEGAGPGATQGLLGRQAIKGGSRSEFSLSGFIEGSKSRASGPPQITASKFAPMTPSTRKSTDLFGTKALHGQSRGQISVIDVPSSSPSSPSEESVVFWIGESFTIIPNLSKYWAANSRKSANGSNLFNGAPEGRMIKLENIDLQGERCSGIDQLVKSPSSNGLPSDILILGEHRFTILSTGTQTPFQYSNRTALVQKDVNAGELDVIGIDQALARMEKSNGFPSKSKSRSFH